MESVALRETELLVRVIRADRVLFGPRALGLFYKEDGCGLSSSYISTYISILTLEPTEPRGTSGRYTRRPRSVSAALHFAPFTRDVITGIRDARPGYGISKFRVLLPISISPYLFGWEIFLKLFAVVFGYITRTVYRWHWSFEVAASRRFIGTLLLRNFCSIQLRKIQRRFCTVSVGSMKRGEGRSVEIDCPPYGISQPQCRSWEKNNKVYG